MVALLERASLVVGNDTGPMHVAAALRVAAGDAVWADRSGTHRAVPAQKTAWFD